MTDAAAVATPKVVASSSELEAVLAEARSSGAVGLDTEFLREKTYRARLCLVQLATADAIYLVDPLKGFDISAIAEMLADPDVDVVVHAGRQDLELLFEMFGRVPKNVFDVQVAAAYTGVGASLPYGRLVETVLGPALTKGEAYSDWCRRPLTEQQLRYAADDVRYLLDLALRLKERLASLGRGGWMADEMTAFESESYYATDPDELWTKVSGRGTLNSRQLAVLRALARWREAEAQRRDLPRGWILKDPTLVEIARRAPSSPQALSQIRGMNSRDVDRSGRAILRVVKEGKETPPIETSSSPPRSVQVRARMLAGVADALVRARCEAAKIAPELVATRSDVESLIALAALGTTDGANHLLLRGWRKELVGDALVDLVRGRIALRAIDAAPYVEELTLSSDGKVGEDVTDDG